MAYEATAWRSPLSILMGARRNDDDDLELREDYFHPRSRAAAPSPAAAPPRSPAPAPAAEASVEPRPSSGGLASYLPFSYFGLTSPAPASAGDKRNGPGNNNANGESAAPPRGAFPPPISESSPSGGGGGGAVDEDFADEVDMERQYSASHPWFNQLDMNDDEGDNPPNHQRPEFARASASGEKRSITWNDQKAIIWTTFNFANSIIGAGAMGLGGAFAASGGGISIIMLIGCAYLTKTSLDIVIDLSSCPSVIRKARPMHDHSDGDSVDGSSFLESSSISEELESNEPSAHDDNDDIETTQEESERSNPFEAILKNADKDQPKKNDSPPSTDNKKEGEVTNVTNGEESPQKGSNEDASPLMAHEDGQNENDKTGDLFQTPTKATGLGIDDHPLALPSPGRLSEKDLYESLGGTQPRHFSPLVFNGDDIPKVKSTTSIQNDNQIQQRHDTSLTPCTYEELGRAAYGSTGRLAVLLSKSLYAFGCLVAYVVVVRDNFGLALRRIIIGQTSPSFLGVDEGHGWLYDDDFLAFWVSAIIMLPLSCPRTMKPLAKFSLVSIISMVFLILVVVYLYFTCTNPETSETKTSFYQDWIEIRFTGFVESLGCFVFTFVCHHTVNLAYESLPAPIRNPRAFARVSTNSIALALESSLAIGIFAYLTFGSQTPADVLMGYPADLTLANFARVLLCITMVLTFPLPFLTCREMSILIFVDMHSFYHVHRLERFNIFSHINYNGMKNRHPVPLQDAGEGTEFVQMSFFKRWRWRRRIFGTENAGANEEWWGGINGDGGAAQALLSEEGRETAIITNIGGSKGKEINPSPLSSRSGDASSSETTISSVVVPTPRWILPNGDGRQLTLLWHAALTFALWFVVTICAIKSPSLGDVLDLVGAFTGTLLVFILPALFSFKLKGYSHICLAILGIGGIVGLLGTIFSFIKFISDVE